MRALLLAVALLPACHLSHAIDDASGDAGAVVVLDAAATDAPIDTRPLGVDTPPEPEGIRCGPNTCRGAEICCDARCGICAFAGECPTFECPGG